VSLPAFQRALVALYAGKTPDAARLTHAERRALEGLDPKALARYRRGLALKSRAR